MIRFLLLFIITISVNAQTVDDFLRSKNEQTSTNGNAGVDIANLSRQCQSMQQSPLVSIANVYIPKFWSETTPVAPFVGLVTGMTQSESMIFKLCDVLIQMDQIGLLKSSVKTAGFLNDLTGGAFNAEYNLYDKMYNVSNSIYDFENGKTKKGALANAQTHKDLVDLSNQAVKYYQTKKGDKDPSGIETKAQRKKELDRIARISYQRAIIQEASSCPVPQDNIDFQKKYVNFVPARNFDKNKAKKTADFYYDKLNKMGSDFIESIQGLTQYTADLNNLTYRLMNYKEKIYNYKEKTYVPTRQKNKDGTVKKKKITKSKKVNTFVVVKNPVLMETFIKKYVPLWEKYISSQLLTSGSLGLFDDKRGRIENKYRDYNFECSELKLQKSISAKSSDSNYYLVLQKRQQECQKDLKFRDKDFKNLMDKYVTLLVYNMGIFYKKQAEIWNFEAIELGYNRVVSDYTNKKENNLNYQQMTISCSESLEPAELQQLHLKSQNVTAEMKEEWLKQKTKGFIMDEEKLKADIRVSKEINNNNEKKGQAIKNKPSSINPGIDLKIIRGI